MEAAPDVKVVKVILVKGAEKTVNHCRKKVMLRLYPHQIMEVSSFMKISRDFGTMNDETKNILECRKKPFFKEKIQFLCRGPFLLHQSILMPPLCMKLSLCSAGL